MSAGSGMGAAASGIGSEMQGWANVMDKWSMQEAYKDEAIRQGRYSSQALGAFNKNLPNYSAPAAQQAMQTGATDRMAKYGMVEGVPLTLTKQFGMPQLTSDYGKLTGQNRANLGAYGDWQHQLGVKDLDQQRLLAQILNFAKGTASVFPYTMYQAQHSNDDLAALGQMIASLGGATSDFASLYNTTPTTKNKMAYNQFMSGNAVITDANGS